MSTENTPRRIVHAFSGSYGSGSLTALADDGTLWQYEYCNNPKDGKGSRHVWKKMPDLPSIRPPAAVPPPATNDPTIAAADPMNCADLKADITPAQLVNFADWLDRVGGPDYAPEAILLRSEAADRAVKQADPATGAVPVSVQPLVDNKPRQFWVMESVTKMVVLYAHDRNAAFAWAHANTTEQRTFDVIEINDIIQCKPASKTDPK